MIQKIVIGLLLVVGLNGCFSEKDKKAKEIQVNKIIDDHKKEKAAKKSIEKDTKNIDYSKW